MDGVFTDVCDNSNIPGSEQRIVQIYERRSRSIKKYGSDKKSAFFFKKNDATVWVKEGWHVFCYKLNHRLSQEK